MSKADVIYRCSCFYFEQTNLFIGYQSNRRRSFVKEYQARCTRTLYRTRMHSDGVTEEAAQRLKIYCTPTSFSEFMVCKVETPKIYVAATEAARCGRAVSPTLLLNPKRESGGEEANRPLLNPPRKASCALRNAFCTG